MTETEVTREPKRRGAGALPLPSHEMEERTFPGTETDFRIILEESAYQAVLRHGASNPDVELCGVLVGNVCRDRNGSFLLITHALEGKEARQESSRVSFTHSTWDHIYREMDARHPDQRIVGWYHMHPGFGVFLSEMDLFVQQHFFGAAWQVAMVLDQKSERIGLFHWEQDQVVRARRYWVGSEPRWDPPERVPVSVAPPAPDTGRGRAAGNVGVTKPPEDDLSAPQPQAALRFWKPALVLSALFIALWALNEHLARTRVEKEVATIKAYLMERSITP